MAKAGAKPQFGWGDIIRVPPRALCPDGLHPDYGAIYGVVISSQRLWRNDFNYNKAQRRRRKKAGLRDEHKGQYLVALIAEKFESPAMELQIVGDGPFKGWVITGGLFVNVLETQIDDIPPSERYRDHLSFRDRRNLRSHLRKLLDYDPLKRDSGKAEADRYGRAGRWLRELQFWKSPSHGEADAADGVSAA